MVPSIPQEIIDKIIDSVHDHENNLLRTYSLVSRSFLYPSRKRLFAHITLLTQAQCQCILDLLIRHPYIQSFVKSLTIIYHPNPCIEDVIPAVLRLLLPVGSLSTLNFKVHVSPPADHEVLYDWRELSGNLRDTLFDAIHSPSLTSLKLAYISHVPTRLLLGLKGVRALTCNSVYFNDDTHGVSQTADFNEAWTSASADRAPIEDFTWAGREDGGPIVKSLPFLTHPRVIFFTIGYLTSLDTPILFLRALHSGLHSPAMLERLIFHCTIDYEDLNRSCLDVHALDIWTELDSLAAHPLYANLHEVTIIIWIIYPPDYDDEIHNGRWVRNVLPQKLPLLASKHILRVGVRPTDFC